MIFGPELLPKVLDGSKTVTRRPVKYDHQGRVPCRYQVGRVYAIQDRRGGRALAFMRVVSNGDGKPEHLQDLVNRRLADVPREGFSSIPEFGAYWERLYGEVDWGREVWRIEFELVQP